MCSQVTATAGISNKFVNSSQSNLSCDNLAEELITKNKEYLWFSTTLLKVVEESHRPKIH